MNPPKPKYQVTWNPQLVLGHIKSLGTNKQLKLENITKKLTSLLTIATAHRVQTLAVVEMQNINVQKTSVQIKITAKMKTTGRSKYHSFME